MSVARAIFTALLFHICICTAAQAPNLRFINYGLEEGLSQSVVQKIIQGKQGYLWIATQDGLNRFDGTNFKIYGKGPLPQSIPWGFIKDLSEDTVQNIIWIATSARGLFTLNLRNEQFEKVPANGLPQLTDQTINYITCSGDKVWVATKKDLSVIDRHSKKLLKNFGLQTDIIKAIQPNRSEVWAFATNGTVYIIDQKKPGIKKIIAAAQIFKTEQNVTVMDAHLQANKVWVRTTKGLYISGTSYTTLQQGLNKEIIKTNKKNFTHHYPFSILNDSKKNLWIAIDSIGLLLKKKDEKFFHLYEKKKVNPYSISDNYVIQILEDKNGIIWLATENGLNRITPKPHFFTTIGSELDTESDRLSRLFAISTLDEKELVLGRVSDMVIYNTQTKGLTFVANTTGADYGRIYFIKPKDSTSFWAGCKFGLRIVEKKNGKYFFRYAHEYPELERLSSQRMTAYAEVDKDNILLGAIAGGGLMWWNKKKSTIDFFKQEDGALKGPPSNNITKIHKSVQGHFWITTDAGLSKFDPLTKKFTNYFVKTPTAEGKFINDILEDGKTVWLAFYQEGLAKWDGKNPAYTLYDNRQGLRNSSLLNIRFDKAKNIWLSTNNGLSAFNPAIKKFINYTVKDGIQDNEFNRFCVFDTEENIYFGGISGLSIINKKGEGLSQPFPKIVITGFRFHDKNGYTNSHTFNEKKPSLKHFQNDIAIRFASLDFSTNHRTQYAYKLEGYDKAWITNSETDVTYTNLDPGEYRFIVKAANPEFNGLPQITYLPFSVLPAWYQTVLFKILLIASTATLLFLLIRWYYRAKLRKQRTEYEKAMAVQEERNRISSEIHDDIGAGLSGVRLLTELTKQKAESPELKGEVEKIYASVSDLSGKMREVIWSLNTENNTLENLLFYLQREAYNMFEATKIHVSVLLPDEVPQLQVAGEKRRHIYLAVKEALHNCLKHSGANKICLIIKVEGAMLLIAVQDSGGGLFKTNRTGNGLKNMQHRMNELGGDFLMQNGDGTTVQFSIPFKRLA